MVVVGWCMCGVFQHVVIYIVFMCCDMLFECVVCDSLCVVDVVNVCVVIVLYKHKSTCMGLANNVHNFMVCVYII